MRKVLKIWTLSAVGSMIACGGSQPRSQSPEQPTIAAAGANSKEELKVTPSEKEELALEPGTEQDKALLDVSSPYKATFRVDSRVGGLDEGQSAEVLQVAAKKLEACAYKSDFKSHWTVGLNLEVDVSGKVNIVVEGAKAPLVRCLETAVVAIEFPPAAESTKIAAAIMIQYPESRRKSSSHARVGRAIEGGVEGGVVGGVIGGVVGGGYGYGLSGTGGTGYGTIGLGGGGYGTIGHGNRTKRPVVRAGLVVAKGSLGRNTIQRVIRRHLPQFRYCYEKQLIKQPRLQGRVTTSFTISAKGRVMSATAKGMPHLVSRCVQMALKRMTFPRPPGGGIVQVTYPFVFSPGSTARPPRPRSKP